ncbi:hypothetical protein Z950_4145 [Sulfitobacter mediterraneus KCTC 32188]|nr:hypothetical protein Z950_4145 [Sulfitobacter mediterraneus KCTC 32188]
MYLFASFFALAWRFKLSPGYFALVKTRRMNSKMDVSVLGRELMQF